MGNRNRWPRYGLGRYRQEGNARFDPHSPGTGQTAIGHISSRRLCAHSGPSLSIRFVPEADIAPSWRATLRRDKAASLAERTLAQVPRGAQNGP
jgi:hypothetical protein